MGRQYVHLSVDIDTAKQVGLRKSNCPVILEINAEFASHELVPFYVGNDKVWLADSLPARYIRIMKKT